MRYFISDLHFCHSNIINIDGRSFSDCSEMNKHMIEKWNSVVSKNDEVYILGDFSTGTPEETNSILHQLNGSKYLIKGNHDSYIKSQSFERELFVWIKNYAEIKVDNRKVILCHYPIVCYNGQFHIADNGGFDVYMLYGHIHNSPDELMLSRFISETKSTIRKDRLGNDFNVPCNLINCFCMFSDYTPLTLDGWIKNDVDRRSSVLTV